MLGRQVADLLQPTNDIGLLTRHHLVYAGGFSKEYHLPLKLFEEQRLPFSWRGTKDVRWVQARVTWLKTRLEDKANRRGWGPAKRRCKVVLSRFNPSLIYLNDFIHMYTVVLNDILSFRVPVIAQFGGVHASRIASVVNQICRTEENGRQLGRRMSPAITNRLTLVFNCEFLRRHYLPLFRCHFPTTTIYQGIDIDAFHPRETPLRGNHWVFLGRVVKEKGFVEFCQAMVALPRTHIDTIQIIGSGPALDEGLKILRQGGRLDLVRCSGRVARDELPNRLREASILVHPSRDEGLPGSVLEAMATGLSVVASNVGGTSEAIQDGRTGLLVPNDDFAALLRSCRRAAEDEALRTRVGRAARDLVASRHALSNFADEMKRLIDGALVRHQLGANRLKP